ncbi:MAG: hypothetical protein ACTIJJ_05115 [Galactobacter sp.]
MTRRTSHERDERLPDRMRDYRIEAVPRQSPDLHKLAQLFIGMARARADQDQTLTATDADDSQQGSGLCRGGGVESEQQEVNG